MTLAIIKAMGIALLLTILLEGLFGAIWGVRGGRNYIIMLLANLLTNPLVNVIHSYFAYELRFYGIIMVMITALLEISAVTAEWLVYKSRTDIKKPFLFSLCANGFSFLCGILINLLR
ncbi:MAG: hypothetical protein ACI4J0_00430 [Huintestinicola sp.]|uniref:hypothetical protein n=1 Tax=Huintestinicola sp. TaxID=2981661 RepID=UPI003F046133